MTQDKKSLELYIQTLEKRIQELEAIISKTGRPSRFTDEEKDEIRKLKSEGKSYKEIADKFGCSRSSIQFIVGKVLNK